MINAIEERHQMNRRRVTDDKCAARDAFATRNAPVLHCVRCGCEIAPGAPVWRQRTFLGFGFAGGSRRGIRPHCRKCRSSARDFAFGSCKNCGRPVYRQRDRWRRFTFCCERCAQTTFVGIANTAAKAWRAKARGSSRPCKQCSKPFKPARTDARYCSNACRQRAYRQSGTA